MSTTTTPKMTPVPSDQLLSLLGAPESCPVEGRAARLVTDLFKAKEPALLLQFADNKLAAREASTLRNHIKRHGLDQRVWVMQRGSCDGSDVIVINLKKSGALVRRLHANRPKRGRFSAVATLARAA